MGTRALAKVYDESDKVLVTIYRHMDGYPEGFGAELEDFSSTFKLVNGLSSCQEGNIANGMGCFAASLIKELKEGPGSIYIVPPEGGMWEEYVYHIKPNGERISISVEET